MRGAATSMLRLLSYLFISLSLLAVAQAETTHRQQWDISPQFNGHTTAPTIRAMQGDTVVVTVTNTLLTENVVIHWHGIREIGTPWADGTEGVTQYAILPGEMFTYTFVVDRPGTFTYGAHHSRDSAACLRGKIVVDVPRSEAGPSTYGAMVADVPRSEVEPCAFQERDGSECPAGIVADVPQSEAESSAYQPRYGRARIAAGNGMIGVDVPWNEPEPSAYPARHGRNHRAGSSGTITLDVPEPSAYGREHAVVRTGRPSIDAVAMAGGTYDWTDDEEDGMPPEHLLVESLEEVLPPPPAMFLGLVPSRLEEETRVIFEGIDLSNQDDTKDRILLWIKAVRSPR